jgi:hypothetical protein
LCECKGDGIRAQHVIQVNCNNDKVNVYTVDILHVVSIQWSSIKIINDGSLLATSHLIGQADLPEIKEVDDLEYSRLAYSKQRTHNIHEFGLDPKYEKAMLIRNLNGDYGIVKAKWIESQGHLSIHYFDVSTKKSLKFEIENNLVYSVRNEYLDFQVNLNKGHIIIKFLKEMNEIKNLEVESNLALIFSISVLHVLLQPKVKPMLNLDLKKFVLPNMYPGNISFDLNKSVLLSCVGYAELTRSDAFYCYYKNFSKNNTLEYYDNVDLNKCEINTDWLFNEKFRGFEICLDNKNSGLNDDDEYSDYGNDDFVESKFEIYLNFEN